MSTASTTTMRRIARGILATLGLALAIAAVTATSAGAVKIANPSDVPGGKDFVAAISGGYVQINGSKAGTPVQNTFSLNFGELVAGQPDPRPKLRGTISSSGVLTIPKAQVSFPPITFPVDATHTVGVTFVATQDWTGSVDPLTGKVSLLARMLIQLSGDAGVAVLDPATCRIGTTANPVTINAVTHTGESLKSITYLPDPSKGPPTVLNPTNFAFPGGPLLGQGYSDEAGTWPTGPEPVPAPTPRPSTWAPQLSPRDAGTFRAVDDTLAVPASSGCLGGAGDSAINNLLGLPAAAGSQRASFDISFIPGAGREGSNAIVQKGVKSNFTAPGLSTPSWPSTEVPQLPTQVPLTIDASSSTFSGTPNATERYRFDLGTGSFGPWGLASSASVPAGFTSLGTKTIRVQVKDADGDVDTKVRTIDIVQSSDISITKTATTSSFRAGSSGTYLLDVHNNSGLLSNSQPVTVTDTLPAGATLTSVTGAGWTCTTGSTSFSCTRPTGTIAAGASAPLSVVVAVSASAGASLSNTATITQLGDPNSTNDTSTVVTPVRRTDLKVTSSHTPTDVPANGIGAYTIDVENVGDGETVGTTTVTTVLPSGLTYVPSGSGGAGWTCTTGAGNTVTCATTGSIGANASAAQITLRVKVDRATVGTLATDVTVATADDTDAFSGANHVVDETNVVTVPDLALRVSHSPATVVVGDTVTYDLHVANESIVSVTGTTTLASDLPAGLTVAGTPSGSGWDCAASTATQVRCTTDATMASGTDAPVVHVPVHVGHDSYPSATVAATVANPNDGYAGNDGASDQATVTRVDVSISKRVDQSNFSVGVPGTYKIAVKNEGSATTVGDVTVVDDLPATVDYVSATGPGWSCATPAPATPRHVECVRTAALAPGAIAPDLVITVTVTDAAAESGTVVNTATVATPRDDASVPADAPVTDNNSSTYSIAAISVDVAVTEVSHGTALRVGTPGEYAVKVANVGAIPTVAGEPVTLTVDLPAGVTPGTVTPDRAGWACTDAVLLGAHRITCVNAPAAGVSALPATTATSTASFAIPVDVDDSAPAEGDTVATISTRKDANPDTSPNNVRHDAITAINRVDLGVEGIETKAPFAGHTGRYVAKVTNHGTAATYDASTVTLTLPEGTSYTPSASGGSGWNCAATPAGGTNVSCTRSADLAAGADAPDLAIAYRVDARPPAETWTQAFDVATVGEPSTRLANNHDTVDSTLQVVDLTLTKWHVPNDVHAGRTGSARLVVKNIGNAASSTPITVTDALDVSKLVALSASGPGWRCDAPAGNVLTCAYLDSAAPGETLPAITTVFRAASDATDEEFDSAPLATVTSTDDVRHDNDTAADPTKVIVTADLSVTQQSVSATEVKGGRLATDVYTVKNIGAQDASDVTADVFYSDGIALGTPISASPNWTCTRITVDPDPDAVSGHPVHVRCTLDEGIPSDDVVQLGLRIRPKASAAGTTQSSVLTVGAAGDANASNDTVSRDIAITAPDLSVATLGVEAYTATDPTDALLSGKPAVYSAKIENVGNEVTNGPIRATFDLPADAGFTDAPATTNYGADWSCTLSGTRVSCAFGGSALIPGASTTVRIPLTPSAKNAPTITPSIAVSTQDDANPANDTRSVTDKVVNPPVVVPPVVTTPTTTTPTPPPAGATAIAGRLVSGAIRLGSLPELALTANQLAVGGTLSSGGGLSLPKDKIKFTTISVDAGSVVPGATAKIILSAVGDGTGRLPAAGGTGSVTVPVSAKVEVYAASGAPLLNLGASSNCTIGPIVFDLSGPYDAGSKVGTFASSSVSVPAPGAGCGAIGGTLGSAIGIPSETNAVSLKLAFTTGSSETPALDPGVAPTPTPIPTPVAKEAAIASAVTSALVSKKGALSLSVACTSTAAIDSCSAGRLTLKAKVKTKKKQGKRTVTVTKTVTVGSASYAKLPAGKTATVKVTLNKTGKKLAKPGTSVKVTAVLQSSATGAQAVSGPLTLKYAKAKKAAKKT